MSTIADKFEVLRSEFPASLDREAIYHKIIAWGKKLPAFKPEWRIEENIVPGCQSLMYLHAEQNEGRFIFAADSDALISRGLAALLVFLYSGETREVILLNPPTILEELGIISSLSPGRSNGLASLYIRMKEKALK